MDTTDIKSATLLLRLDLCDNGVMVSYPDDGTRFVVEGDKETCTAIGNEIMSLLKCIEPAQTYNVKVEIAV